MATSKQIRGIFAFAVLQNKTMIISNLNANGYPTPMNISNQQLVDKLYSIYNAEGFDKISTLFSGVKILPASQSDAIALKNDLLPASERLSAQQLSTQKTFLETLQELWAGAKDVIGGSKSTTSQPAVSPMTAGVVLVVLAAIVGVIIWKA